MRRSALSLMLGISLISACSEPATAQPTLTVEYLNGGWVSPEGDCNAEWGPDFVYTANGEMVFEDDREEYKIRGNRVYFLNPIDDYVETYDEIVPIDRNSMRLRQQNSDWIVLHRCSTAIEPASLGRGEGTAGAPGLGEMVQTDAGRYRVEIDPKINLQALPMNADLRMADGDLTQYALQLCGLDFENQLAPTRCEVFMQPDQGGLLVGYVVLQDGHEVRVDTAVVADRARSGIGCFVSGVLENAGGQAGDIDIAQNFEAILGYSAWEKSPGDWMVSTGEDNAGADAAHGRWYIKRQARNLRINQERWNYCFRDRSVYVDEVFTHAVTLTRL